VVRILVLVAIIGGGGCAHHPPVLDSRCGGVAPVPIAVEPSSIGLMADRTIADVNVTGADAALAATLREMLATKPGTQLGNDVVRDDLRKLWALGVLSDVRVDVAASHAGAAVTFAVTPQPLIDHVYMLDGLPQELRRLRWLAGTPYEPVRIARMAAMAQATLVFDGYVDATVEVKRAAGPGVGVCVIAKPGQRVTVGTLAFPGAVEVPHEKLVAALSGAKARLNRPGGIYDEQAMREDTMRMLELYYEIGRIDTHVDDPQTVRREDHVDVSIPIHEGSVYRLGTIRVLALGGKRFALAIKPGEVFVRSRITAAIAAIEQRVGTDTNVYPVTKIDHEHHTVDIDFTIEWRRPWHALRLLPSR
jgi:outer membrane protein insertion porin family